MRVAIALVLGLIAACGSAPEAKAPPLPAPIHRALVPASIRGTVLSATTGEPVRGARVEAPDGATAQTDADGHFLLTGLAPGTAGALRVTAEGDLVGQNLLRPLAAGVLEVVIFVARGR